MEAGATPATPDALDPRLTLGGFLKQIAERSGDRPALHYEGRTTSYRELYEETRELARALIGAGVVKGTRVAVHMANRPEWIRSTYAVGMLGGVVIPVNTFATRQELRYILRHSDTALLLMQPSLLKHHYLDDLLEDYPEIAKGEAGRLRCPELPNLRRVVSLEIDAPRGGVETWDQLLALQEGVSNELLDAVAAEVHPTDDGIVIYTSGTTAAPKAVLHSHRAPVLQAWRIADLHLVGPDDRIYTTYPFFWSAGIAMSLGAALAAGGCLLLQQVFEPGAALDLIESQRATFVHAWPHQGKALREHPSIASRDLSSLQKVERGSPLAGAAGAKGNQEDSYGVGASYGLSETCAIASSTYADAPVEIRKTTHGKPLPGVVFRIVDPHTGETLPEGAEGEICVKGVTFMRGYYKVHPERYLDADGFFHTQDGGSLDAEGYLHWSGRLSNIIKTGGANVSPVEIEEALRKHPAIKVAIPVGIEHPTLGEAIVLCAVPVEGEKLVEDEIRAYLRERLAAYKVPKRVVALRADELSYTGNQKIQVGPLREAALARLQADKVEIDGYRYGEG